MDYYEKLCDYTIKQLCKERQQHENEVIETTISQIELQPLKPDSVYKVKFQKGASIDNVGQVIKVLNKQCKDRNIVFVPNCDYFEIIGE